MKRRKSNPYLVILSSFLGFLIMGSVLLYSPPSQLKPTSFIDCLFIATSAFTVTGLSPVDITEHFNYFGLTILLILVQAGGLGLVTLAMVVFIMIGKKVGLKNRFLISEALNQGSIGGVLRLVRFLFFVSLAIELLGTTFLAMEWIPRFGIINGLYRSFFTAVSAFNNAGFALDSNNLINYQSNPVINFVITTLIIVGGLGFTVLIDCYKKNSFQKLRVHTKIMLVGTLLINISATMVIYLLEMNNYKTLGGHIWYEKLQMAYFQAITTRTAGFNTIDISDMNTDSILVMMLLMFIGGGSTSTAGGIKLTTAAVILFGTLSFIKQHEQINIYKRAIDFKFLLRSFAIVVLSSAMIFSVTFLLVLLEPNLPFLQLFFEVVSAFGTVGLTMGITDDLSAIGKLLIIIMMIIGKIGVLTIVFTFSRPKKQAYHFPKEDILTG
ncbi:Ktr system potassium transporter B [Macrococcus lamae]|uniref:Ktr system potassium transporter B n=1 Tax=Macrococcus lamae TaxID=198484 RepID=A0A4R6BSJ0_9STAP|nr:Ktr system potassium transporter B [Macrococcus lamae]